MPKLTEEEQRITERLKQRYKEAKERDRGRFDPTSDPEKASDLELEWEPDPPLPAKREPAASFAPPIPAALQAFDSVRHLIDMNRLDGRSLRFLQESNAIEEITNIDYADPQTAIPGKGHAGAFLESQQMGAQRRLLTLEDICRWQGMLAEEQLRFGHDLPRQGIGRLRSLEVPFNVWVGNYSAPPFFEVPELMATWVSDLQRELLALPFLAGSGIRVVELLGDSFQRFEAIHPFVDGNGRTGRLIVSYLCTFARSPIIIFRAGERPAYYEAHQSKLAMRCFMADKIREAAYLPDGQLLERTSSSGPTDIYTGGGGQAQCDWRELIKVQQEWHAALKARRTQEAANV